MEDFHSLSGKIETIQENISLIKEQSSELIESSQEDTYKILSLTDRVKTLLEMKGQDSSNIDLLIALDFPAKIHRS